MRIETDRRSIEYEPDDEGIGLVRDGCRTLIDQEIQLARHVTRIWRSSAWVEERCASLEEFGRRCNLTSRRTRLYNQLGNALDVMPRLEEDIRGGTMTVEHAAWIGRLTIFLGKEDPENDWVKKASELTVEQFERAIRMREAELRQRDPMLTEMRFFVSSEVRTRVDRSRVVASRKRHEPLSAEDGLDEVVTDYLERYDPFKSSLGTGTRRVPPGGSSPYSRYTAVEVKLLLWHIHGDICCVPGCTHRVFIDRAHVKPKSEGGDQEADNLLPLCKLHHTLYDDKKIILVGLTDQGRAIFETDKGALLHPDVPVAVTTGAGSGTAEGAPPGRASGP